MYLGTKLGLSLLENNIHLGFWDRERLRSTKLRKWHTSSDTEFPALYIATLSVCHATQRPW